MIQKPVLLTCYTNPDIDGFACLVAYQEFLEKTGPSAGIFYEGNPHDEVLYVFRRFNLAIPAPAAHPENFNRIALVDASTLSGLAVGIDPNKVVEVIDHRKAHDAEKFPHAAIQIELVGSAATLIAEKYMEKNVGISALSAILLYTAIISNTLNFQASVTTDRDSAAAAWLMGKFDVPEGYTQDLFASKSNLAGAKLQQRLRGEFASFGMGKKQVGIIQIEIVGTEALVAARKTEVLAAIREAQVSHGLDYCFASFVDLAAGFNLFVTADAATQKILEGTFALQFKDDVLKRQGLLMRKEVVPIMQAYLSRSGA